MSRVQDVLARFSGYLLSGGGAAVVDIGLFSLFAPAIGVVPGAALSFLIAAVCNFFVTSAYVFGQARDLRRGALFLAFAGLGLVINVAATALVFRAFQPPLLLAKTGGVGVAFLFNFAASYLIVFRRARDPSGTAPSAPQPRDAAPLHTSIPKL